jgi:hypothetical protein
LEKDFLVKESSGSNVILKEIQDTSHNTISDTDQINPPLDSSTNEHLEEPNPQIVVEEILVPYLIPIRETHHLILRLMSIWKNQIHK